MIRVHQGRTGRVAACMAAVLVAASTTLVPTPAGASFLFALTRISGIDRYATSAQVAQAGFTKASTAILATGESYPDALAASFLAGNLHAPILLTTPDVPMSPFTTAALTSLGTTNVIIVGGTSAVSQAEQTQLSGFVATSGAALSVSRISGVTRYDTMAAVDDDPGTTVGTLGGERTAFLATGENFPDALGAAPVSYAEKFPIVLTQSQTLTPQAASTLKTLGIQQVLILGGTSAVSSAVESAVNAMGITTLKRFAGADRSGTSVLLAEWAISTLGFKDTKINVASGDPAFGGADALSTGPLGGSEDPVATLLTNSATDPGQVVTFATQYAGALASGYAIGGTTPLPSLEVSTINSAGEAGSGSSGGGGSSSGSGGGGSGGGSDTGSPALTGARVVSTTVPDLSSPTNPAGTVIQYDFSAPLNGAFVAADFKAWPGNDVVNGHAGYTPTGICGFGAPCPAGTGPEINVLFGEAALQSTTGPDSAGSLTLATVAPGAVTGEGGLPNPPGSAAITGTSGLAFGAEQAPYITTASSAPRAATAPASSAIDVSFDVAAYPQAASTTTGVFDLVFAANVINSPTSATVIPGTNNEEEECTGPSSSMSTVETALTTPAFDPTALTVTIVCPNPGNAGAPMTSAQIGWIVMQPGAVGLTPPAGSGDTTDAVLDVSPTPHVSAAPVPRLTGVTLTRGTNGQPDVAAYTFDEPVTGSSGSTLSIVTTDFDLVQADGGTTAAPFGDQGGGTCATTAPASYPGCEVVSTAGDPTIDLLFPRGTFEAFGVVGGAVKAGAVVDANNQVVSNADDEFTSGGGATEPSGSINAVQLTAASLTYVLSPFDVPFYTLKLTFSEAITLPPANDVDLQLYDSDGTQLECVAGSATLGTGVDDNQVSCSDFDQGSSATAATLTQVSTGTLATVAYDTVTGNAAVGVANEATNNNPNPEGQQSV